MSDCIFCKIAAGQIKSDLIYEDDTVVAFRDINPQAPVHVQVIPRRHIENAAALTDDHRDLSAHVILVAAQVARDEGVEEGGYRLVANVGPHGGQSVPHLHIHVLGGREWPGHRGKERRGERHL